MSVITRDDVRAQLDGPGTTIPTRFQNLDAWMSGMAPGELWAVCGPPTIGTESFVMGIALRLARSNVRVAYFSLERGRQGVLTRIILHETGVGWLGMHRHDEQRERAERALEALIGLPLHIEAMPWRSVREIRARIRDIRPSIVVVDHLDAMHSPDPLQAAADLKQLAVSMRVPVLLRADTTPVERRELMPVITDMPIAVRREADVVLAVHRMACYGRGEAGEAEVVVLRNGRGPTGAVQLVWDPERAVFANLKADWQPCDRAWLPRTRSVRG